MERGREGDEDRAREGEGERDMKKKREIVGERGR